MEIQGNGNKFMEIVQEWEYVSECKISEMAMGMTLVTR